MFDITSKEKMRKNEKKTKQIKREDISTSSSQFPLKSLHVTSTDVIYSDNSYGNEKGKLLEQRHEQKFHASAEENDLESGRRQPFWNDHTWQVLYPLKGGMELVHLRRANFGLRWHSSPTHTKDPPKCMMGPHWWLMALTFTVFSVLVLVVTVLTAPKAGLGELLTGVALSTACLSMYALVGCSNPGIVQRISSPPDDTYTYCDNCESYRPERALHCMDCRVCIEEYDHHCPWTGKCVGKGNVRYFYAWLFFLVLAFVYEVIEFTTYMMPPEDQPHPDQFMFPPSSAHP